MNTFQGTPARIGKTSGQKLPKQQRKADMTGIIARKRRSRHGTGRNPNLRET